MMRVADAWNEAPSCYTAPAWTRRPVLQTASDNLQRIYENDGNRPLMALLDRPVGCVLDVGCGAGRNAELLRRRYPNCEVHGITRSVAEAEIAASRMTSCRVCDIEAEIPPDLKQMRFDALVFSHVLEHVREPECVLRRFAPLLNEGGAIVIAVPNVLSWAMRWQFLRGHFEYQPEGVLDDTHLRFFTYFTADRYLLANNPDLRLVSKSVTGSVPLWWLRRYILPIRCSEAIDAAGCRRWPNLFAWQILLKAVYRASSGAAALIREPERLGSAQTV